MTTEMVSNQSGDQYPSNLELVFGFRNSAFNRYMRLQSTSHTTPAELLELSVGMADDDHPMVRYGAGWAAAEAAMYRTRLVQAEHVGVFSLEKRMQALSMAEVLWVESRQGFDTLGQATHDVARSADIWSFGIRAARAQAFMSSMGVVARWSSGAEPPLSEVEPMLEATVASVSALGSTLLGAQADTIASQRARRGLVRELTADLFFQLFRPLCHVVVASSVRQDHNARPTLRGDLVAVGVNPPHKKTLVAVTNDPQPDARVRMTVSPWSEMQLRPHGEPDPTLQALVDRVDGRLRNKQTSNRLDQLAYDLAYRLAVRGAKN